MADSKRAIIHQFDPVIYPVKLWVGINPPFEDVEKMFYGLNSETERIDITSDAYESDHFTIARTHPVASKSEGWIGLLVTIRKVKQCKTGIICHESAHCADFICGQFGITAGNFEGGEAYAYLIGWIADCIEKVLKNKLI